MRISICVFLLMIQNNLFEDEDALNDAANGSGNVVALTEIK